ncbi:MAG: 2-oxo-4-hydroxy-4-carboxy-5-ureidoimidazoline decarboxylase [Pyrinomonadaceae bacterium]
MENLPNGLHRLNALPHASAENEFLKCCGSKSWAAQMTSDRPFTNVAELTEAADRIWWQLSPADWLDAFRSHPKIGEKKPAQKTSAASLSWSSREQAGVDNAPADTTEALADLNCRYEEKFGFIYIVCATGKSSAELLAILRERLTNERDTELRIAASEQAKITRLRLHKLIGSLEQG